MHHKSYVDFPFSTRTCEQLAREAAAGNPYAQAACEELLIDFERPGDIMRTPPSPLTTAATVPHEPANPAAPEVNSRGRAFWKKVHDRPNNWSSYVVYRADGTPFRIFSTPRKAAQCTRRLNSQLR